MVRRYLLLVLVGTIAAGCQTERFRSRNLGRTDLGTAYETALDVFGDYYSIASTDRRAGRITGRPKRVSAARDRTLSTSPVRESAVLRVRREGEAVWADVRVAIERQEAGSFRSLTDLSAHRDVPDHTPAERDAPFTREQNQAWRVTGNNADVERRILIDLYDRLNPEP